MKKILLPLCLATSLCSTFSAHSLTFPDSSKCIEYAIKNNKVDPEVYFMGLGRLHNVKEQNVSGLVDSTGEYLGLIFMDKYTSVVEKAENCDVFMSNMLTLLDREAELSSQIQNAIDQYSRELQQKN